MSEPVLIDGQWRAAHAMREFQADNPTTGKKLPPSFPVSDWRDVDEALTAAHRATAALRSTEPAHIADFLDRFASRIEQRAGELIASAHTETALPALQRLATVELPRTTGQLRQAANAARDGSWALPTIDTAARIRSVHAAIGPVLIFGPNNFPFAFNAVAGGDFAAAIAAGNPVIAKAHPAHPRTSQLLAEEAFEAVREAGLPPGTVQLLYHLESDDGLRAAGDRRLGAVAFTGSRPGGLALKAAADRAGVPIYLELSSINPVVFLPGALAQRGSALATEFAASCLLGAGQFCTNPGIIVLSNGAGADAFLAEVKRQFAAWPPAPLLTRATREHLVRSIESVRNAGAELISDGSASGQGFHHPATLLCVSGARFLAASDALQAEMFGPAALVVIANDLEELNRGIEQLEPALTASIYSAPDGTDDPAHDRISSLLRGRVGRLLNDKMPTGVAVSPAMQHGGPYPASGHPGFTSVGIPASMRRFTALQCYDNVRDDRLPPVLRERSPLHGCRFIDGRWTNEALKT